jgi:NTP pyrophosphatase (non-canonical NTP hydrolase)
MGNGKISDGILRSATERYGQKSRWQMLQEECMELAMAIHKYLNRENREKNQEDNLCDEIADVKIMLHNIELDNPHLENKINERIDFKMNRIRERLLNNELL